MKPILPGATIGVLGSGQLGRMFSISARQMGYRVATLSPDSDTPTGQVADIEHVASYDDTDAIRTFARQVDVVTFEFENVPPTAVEVIDRIVPVRPSGEVLYVTQQRVREKQFLQRAGIPIAPFRVVRSLEELWEALSAIRYPAVLKTADFGYDGKGQARITEREGAEVAWKALRAKEAVLEAFVDYECELSVVVARSIRGQFVHYGTLENRHLNHILDETIAPARIPPKLVAEALDIARTIVEALRVTGVICVEYFLTRDRRLLVNEIAPRPHNSGHFTIDACATSQFEQQLRAVCDLPFGSTAQMSPAAMVNLLGDLWQSGEPDWASACSNPDVKLHLYGKLEARPGRKMGHLTALGNNIESCLSSVRQARAALVRP